MHQLLKSRIVFGVKIASICLFVGFTRSALAVTATIVADNGFESPNVGSGVDAYQYKPTGTPWVFTNVVGGVTGSGIAANGSLFNVTNATNGNSDGTTSTAGQAGILQDGDGSVGLSTSATIDQLLTLTAGTYSLSFGAEGRNRVNNTNPISAVIYNQAMSSTYLRINYTPLTLTTFTQVSGNFTVPTSGGYYLYFVGDDGTGQPDVTSFVDNVSVVAAVPEPTSLGLLALSATGLLRRRRGASNLG